MRLEITWASEHEAADAASIAREAADWLAATGRALWDEAAVSLSSFEMFAARNELVIARVGSRAAATMFLHRSDAEFWPHDPPGVALYVHRLAVARAFAGKGLSQAMLAWAEDQVRRESREFLRLDCVPRPALLRLYRDTGFVAVDPEPVYVGPHLVVRHEKRIA